MQIKTVVATPCPSSGAKPSRAWLGASRQIQVSEDASRGDEIADRVRVAVKVCSPGRVSSSLPGASALANGARAKEIEILDKPIETSERRRGIQSVEIGLRVLSAVAAQPGPSTLSSIAQRADLSSSQTHRYLQSLIASGVVKQESKSSLYDLDAGAIRLGLSALSRMDVFALADEVFQELARSTGHTYLIAVWGDSGPTIIRWFNGRPPVITSLAIGSVLPLLQSATGRVFHAFGDEYQTQARAVAEAKAMGRKVSEFTDQRNETRRNLSAKVEGDLIPGLRAVAAPVFDLQGRLTIVASLLANSADSPSEMDGEARDRLLGACRELTVSLGGTWPSAD